MGGENNIFCQISTKERKIKKYSVELKKGDCEGDIRFDSYIYLDMIFTLHESLIIRKIRIVNNKDVQEEITIKLKKLFFE